MSFPENSSHAAPTQHNSSLAPNLQSAKDFLVHITRRWPEVCEGAQLEVKGPAQ